MYPRAKTFIDQNVWDGEDRTGATGDSVTFTPDELEELVIALLDHLEDVYFLRKGDD